MISNNYKIKVMGHGLDKHELVEIHILDLPKTIRKVYGFAKDKKQEDFFKKLGFKKEGGIRPTVVYSRYFK